MILDIKYKNTINHEPKFQQGMRGNVAATRRQQGATPEGRCSLHGASSRDLNNETATPNFGLWMAVELKEVRCKSKSKHVTRNK